DSAAGAAPEQRRTSPPRGAVETSNDEGTRPGTGTGASCRTSEGGGELPGRVDRTLDVVDRTGVTDDLDGEAGSSDLLRQRGVGIGVGSEDHHGRRSAHLLLARGELDGVLRDAGDRGVAVDRHPEFAGV